jgi:hypothetical protein
MSRPSGWTRSSRQHAEEILELFDWTGLEVEFRSIALDRLKGLLVDSLTSYDRRGD